MLKRELDRVADLAFQTVSATELRVRRVAGFVTTALGRAAREVSALVWDYQDLAGDLRRADGARSGSPGAGDDGTPTAQVLHFQPRRQANQRGTRRTPDQSVRRGIRTGP